MLSKTEQLYLLEMLANNRQHPDKKPNNFYPTMKMMVKKELVVAKWRNGIKVYRLTNYGWAIACCIAKDPDTPERYRKYAKSVEMWIY